MSDWVSCNYCNIKPNSKVNFYITSCGHIYCQACIQTSTKTVCFMCANKCDYKEINHEFERDYNFYFTDLNELDAKFNKMINDFIQVKNKEVLDFINEKRNIRNQVSKKLDIENKYLKDVIKNLKEKSAAEVKNSSSSISSSSSSSSGVFKYPNRFNNIQTNSNQQQQHQPIPTPTNFNEYSSSYFQQNSKITTETTIVNNFGNNNNALYKTPLNQKIPLPNMNTQQSNSSSHFSAYFNKSIGENNNNNDRSMTGLGSPAISETSTIRESSLISANVKKNKPAQLPSNTNKNEEENSRGTSLRELYLKKLAADKQND